MAEYSAVSASRRVAAPAAATVSRRSLLGGTAAIAAGPLWAVAGCSGEDGPEPAGAVDEVTYLTGLGSTGREAFAWVADAKGFFAEEGIKVTIRPGAAGDSNLKVLAGGQAQFISIDYSGVVVRAGVGQFDQFRAVGVIHTKTIIAIMALAKSGIRSPRDLAGKQVGHPAGSVVRTLFPAFARLAGLDQGQVRSVQWHENQGAQLPQLLVAGKLDAIGQYVPAEPTVRAAAKGQAVTVLPYSDFMTDLYGNVVVTTRDVDRDLQRRFVRALNRGLRYAVDHPDEAGEILHAAVPTTAAAAAGAEVALMKGYAGSPVADPALVARSIALMQSVGLVPAGSIDPGVVFDFDIAAQA